MSAVRSTWPAAGGTPVFSLLRRRASSPHSRRRPTVEDIAENWAAINDESGYYVPADLMDWSAHYMAHWLPG